MFNQFTESFSVGELADKVSEAAGGAHIVHLEDPRVELEEHYYRAAHTKLLDLGLLPFLSATNSWPTSSPSPASTSTASSVRPSQPKVMWRSTSSSICRTARPEGEEHPSEFQL